MPWINCAVGMKRLLPIFAGTFLIAPLLAAQVPAAPVARPARFVVVLDAAHGGSDNGASLNGEPEKAFTLALSVRLRSLLAARGIAVVTTREADKDVTADQRAEIANHAAAQACLSLHATESGLGVHLFTSSLAPAQPARMVPWKTAQAAWVARSLELAGVLNSALAHASVPVILGRTGLPGVDSMTCPAVAVEIAPLTAAARTPGHAAGSLDDTDYQAQVATALAAALLEWREGSSQP